jgi:hypothetical protein
MPRAQLGDESSKSLHLSRIPQGLFLKDEKKNAKIE